MIFSFNLDLLSVATVVAANLLIGLAVIFSDRESATARIFTFLTVALSIWSIFNYLTYQAIGLTFELWCERLVLFSAVPLAISFMLFIYTFPSKTWILSRLKTSIVIIAGAVTMISTLTPFVFSGVRIVSKTPTPQPIIEPGMALFALVAVGSLLLGLFLLIWKFVKSKGEAQYQLLYVLVGVAIMCVCIFFGDFIAPTILQNTSFIPLSALFVFPFIVLTAYSIYRYHLFNVKVIATAILGIFVTIFSFINITYATSTSAIILNITAFVIVLLGSIKIVRDTLSLEQANEKLEQLTQQLEKANKQQIVLIHFITHQIKGFVTKSRNIFASILDGDYGTVPDTMKPLVEEGFRSDTQGTTTIQEILNAANIKSGAMSYNFAPMDLAELVEEVFDNLKSSAQNKNLEFTLDMPGKPFQISGDRLQLQNAVKNIIDNAIKYTQSGSVHISVRKEDSKIRFEEQDTGVGITPEDMQHLFTEGGHGAESQKINVESTGFGLYIVKNIIEAHKGKVWAESDGAGKGSRFIIELPAEMKGSPKSL